jgi:Periplasmic binding protein-like domain
MATERRCTCSPDRRGRPRFSRTTTAWPWGVYRAARELGLDIPKDLSVVSIDNQEIIAEGLYPGLTTLALPHYEMGAWAVEHLIGRLTSAAGQREQPGHVVLPCPMVRRGSVAAPPLPAASRAAGNSGGFTAAS